MERWPDPEEILARCRDWLRETRSECEALEGLAADGDEAAEPVGLYQLVEQFTALRHDTRLLTKAVRGAEERGEATLRSLQTTIELQGAASKEATGAPDKVARSLAETLIELDESLARCHRAIERAKHRVVEEVSAELQGGRDRLEALFRTQPWWRRVLCRPWHEAARRLFADSVVDTYRNIFDSLLEGQELIEQRLRKKMEQQSIIRMECLGEPVEPNRMTVVEVVSDPTRRPGTVIEEMRPGYCWQGRVLRFAEVKAVGEH